MTKFPTRREVLREVSYDPLSGIFRRVRTSGRYKAGDPVGGAHGAGYVQVYVKGRQYLAHRLAILIMTGSWPKEQVDHRDGNRSNNRFRNLREATAAQNASNHGGHPARRMSKYRGVRFVSASKVNPWKAWIMINRQEIFLGVFATEEAAHAARLEAEQTRVGAFSTSASRGRHA